MYLWCDWLQLQATAVVIKGSPMFCLVKPLLAKCVLSCELFPFANFSSLLFVLI